MKLPCILRGSSRDEHGGVKRRLFDPINRCDGHPEAPQPEALRTRLSRCASLTRQISRWRCSVGVTEFDDLQASTITALVSTAAAMPATRSYDCKRSACSKVSVTTITSLTPVSTTSFSSPALTVVLDPTIAAPSLLCTAARSQSCHSGSMESTGGNNSTG